LTAGSHKPSQRDPEAKNPLPEHFAEESQEPCAKTIYESTCSQPQGPRTPLVGRASEPGLADSQQYTPTYAESEEHLEEDPEEIQAAASIPSGELTTVDLERLLGGEVQKQDQAAASSPNASKRQFEDTAIDPPIDSNMSMNEFKTRLSEWLLADTGAQNIAFSRKMARFLSPREAELGVPHVNVAIEKHWLRYAPDAGASASLMNMD
jgi:hypothetical protein